MNDRVSAVAAVVEAVWNGIQEKNITFLAGSIAYYAFVSVLPLTLFAVWVATAVGGESLSEQVVSLAETSLSATGQNTFEEALNDPSGRTGASVFGVVVLLWGTLKIFRGLDIAFAEVYDTQDNPSLLHQLRDGTIALVAVGAALAATVAASAAFVMFDVPFLVVLNPVVLLIGLTAAFLPMYYVFPDIDTTVSEALPGTVVAAGGWAVLQVTFQVYAANAGQYQAYGFIGGVLLFLTWLYFGGLLILIGATVNAVLGGYTHHDAIDGAVTTVTADSRETEPARASRPRVSPTSPAPRSSVVLGGDESQPTVAPPRTERASVSETGTDDQDNGGIRARIRQRSPLIAMGLGGLLALGGGILKYRQSKTDESADG